MGKTASLANIGTIADSSLGFRNRIINGAMVIDQRNAGSLGTYSGGLTYYLDRWRTYGSASGKFTVQQTPSATETGYATRVAAGFRNYLNVTSTEATALGSTDIYRIEQPIEGYNIADLGFGTASPSVFTISFWVRSSLTGTFGGAVWNSDASRSCPFSYTISSANTWEYKTVTLTADSTGTWNTSNGQGLAVQWSLGAGSSYLGTAGTWANTFYAGVSGQQNMIGTSGATFNITGVQLEKGSTATSFDYRPYSTELQLCQRYCVNYRSADTAGAYFRYGVGQCDTTTNSDIVFPYPVPMRVTPTVTTTGTASNYAVYHGGSVTACSSVPTINLASSYLIATMNALVASGLTVGRACALLSNNNNTSYLLFSAEV